MNSYFIQNETEIVNDWRIVCTSKPFIRSSRECEAEMQIRALARRSGVAGNATVTTAT